MKAQVMTEQSQISVRKKGTIKIEPRFSDPYNYLIINNWNTNGTILFVYLTNEKIPGFL